MERLDFKHHKIENYLQYPVNYGMVYWWILNMGGPVLAERFLRYDR
jgi:hypothetical protein